MFRKVSILFYVAFVVLEALTPYMKVTDLTGDLFSPSTGQFISIIQCYQ